MKHNNIKKVIIIVLIIVLMVTVFNSETVIARINTEYAGTDTVSNNVVDEAMNGSTVLQWIAKLLYAVGTWLEKIMGTIFKMLTGSSDFPWADKIVFNAVPMLDVNFINPDRSSFVGNSTIKDVIRNVYSTILAIAVTFFAIAVMITAIKLVVSTIASEKAKYKKAVVDWLVGFVMLFCIHFGISFIFYLNEELVVVASKIATTNYDEASKIQLSTSMNQLIENVGNSTYNGFWNSNPPAVGKYAGRPIKEILEENWNVAETWLSLPSGDKTYGLHSCLMTSYDDWHAPWADDDQLITEEGERQNLAWIIAWAADENISVQDLEEIRYNRLLVAAINDSSFHTTANETHTVQALLGEDVVRIFGDYYPQFKAWVESHKQWFYETNANDNVYIGPSSTCSQEFYDEITLDKHFPGVWETDSLGSYHLLTPSTRQKDYHVVCSRGHNDFAVHNMGTATIPPMSWAWDDVLDDLIKLKGASPTSNYGEEGYTTPIQGNNSRLFSNLAAYFKLNAYERKLVASDGDNDDSTITSFSAGNPQIQNMLMYATLVGQSLVLFISYIKRLFYIIMLALMAPIVVVFDFFQKFGK